MNDILKRNNVTILGDGENAMLFAHGFGCDQNAWKYITKEFTSDHKVILFDYVGAGKSDLAAYDANRYHSLKGYASDIIEICETLGLSDVVFVGHSVSAMIGALAAIMRPKLFSKLVFICPSPCYISTGEYIGGFDKATIDSLLDVMDEDYISWAKSIAPSIMDAENGEDLGEELTESFCSIDPAIAKQFARVTFLSDNRKDLLLIPVPSLTIQCVVDMIAPMIVGEYVLKNTPNNRMTVLEAHGHCPHMSHPKETIKAIREFL